MNLGVTCTGALQLSACEKRNSDDRVLNIGQIVGLVAEEGRPWAPVQRLQCEMYDPQRKCPVSSLHQLMASLCSCKRLIEIGNYIVDMLEADR